MVGEHTLGLAALHFTAAIFCNVGGFLVFITFFFFTLGEWIEKLALENQITELLTSALTTPIWNVLPPDSLQTVIRIVNSTHPPTMTSQDAAVAESNAKLQTTSFKLMIPLGFGLIILGALFGGLHTHLVHNNIRKGVKEVGRLFLMTFIMMCSIFVTELAFALLVSRYYLTVPPAWVKAQIVQQVLSRRTR